MFALMARRVFLGLLVAAPLIAAVGWCFTDQAATLAAYLTSACLVAFSGLGLMVLCFLAALTGWKAVVAGDAAPSSQADLPYRCLWAGAGALFAALALPGALLALDAAGLVPLDGVGLEELSPLDLLRLLALPAAVLAALGVWAAVTEPEGHGQPPVPVTEPTAVDADYAARLAARKAQTAQEVKKALEAADELAQKGEVRQAIFRLEDQIEKLGEHHPLTAQLAEKVKELRKQPRPGGAVTE